MSYYWLGPWMSVRIGFTLKRESKINLSLLHYLSFTRKIFIFIFYHSSLIHLKNARSCACKSKQKWKLPPASNKISNAKERAIMFFISLFAIFFWKKTGVFNVKLGHEKQLLIFVIFLEWILFFLKGDSPVIVHVF